MTEWLRGWRAPALGALVIIIAVGAFLAIHRAGEKESEEAAGEPAGEEIVIKDPVKRRYVEHANEICRETEAKWTEAASEIFGSGPNAPTVAPAAELRTYLRLVIPSLREMIAKLRQVPDVPPGDGARIDSYYRMMSKALRVMEKAQRDPSSPGLRRALDAQATLRNQDAINYGLEACGQED